MNTVKPEYVCTGRAIDVRAPEYLFIIRKSP